MLHIEGGQGACPLKLRNFDNFKSPVDQLSLFIFGFQNLNLTYRRGSGGLPPGGLLEFKIFFHGLEPAPYSMVSSI